MADGRGAEKQESNSRQPGEEKGKIEKHGDSEQDIQRTGSQRQICCEDQYGTPDVAAKLTYFHKQMGMNPDPKREAC